MEADGLHFTVVCVARVVGHQVASFVLVVVVSLGQPGHMLISNSVPAGHVQCSLEDEVCSGP